MIYPPNLTPLVEGSESILLEITYEKRYTAVDDITHDADHIHDFYEIYVNLEGEVSFLVEDNVYPIRRGDVIWTAPNELHRCIYHTDGFHEHFCIWIRSLPMAARTLCRPAGGHHKFAFEGEEKQRLIDLCFRLYHSHGKQELCLRAAESFFGILDMIRSGTGGSDTAAQHLPAAFSRIVDHIIAHYTEPFCTIASICQTFYISKSTLCRSFRRYFQTTPSDYIESKRFSEAKKLLLLGQSVQQACLGSGFSDCSYFIMRFRKKFGVTPYRYQRELLAQPGSESAAALLRQDDGK